MNVWKIGSRWGKHQLLEKFVNNHIVFVGNRKISGLVKEDDYIAIAKGKKIVAVAKAAETSRRLTQNDIAEDKIRNLKDERFYEHTEGFRCSILKLDARDQFSYSSIYSFCKANKIKNDVKKLYEIYDRKSKHSSDYDDLFQDQSIFRWYPWIGSNYGKKQKRLLLVGDSHYMHKNPEYKFRDYTRTVIQRWGLGDSDKQVFNRNLRYALIGRKTTKEIKTDFWENVAFYNFVQEPMKTSSSSPSKKQFEEGWKTFEKIIEILNPTDVIFFGVRASENADSNIILVRKDSAKINNVRARLLVMKNDKYKNINIIAIKHPSKCFSSGKWNEYIKNWNPELLDFLRNRNNLSS